MTSSNISDLTPFHVWERSEPLRGWVCVAPDFGGTRAADRCPGCGFLVGDIDVLAVEIASGEQLPQTPLFVHIAYALKRKAEREATDVVADAPDSAPDDTIGAE